MIHCMIGKMLLNCPEHASASYLGWKEALHTIVAKLTFTLSWLEWQLYYSKIENTWSTFGPYFGQRSSFGPYYDT